MEGLKTLWYKLGLKLFGNFFSRVFNLKMQRRKQERIHNATVHRMKKQGLKVFDIGGIKVVAHNQRNAERKAANIKAKLQSYEITIPKI